MIRRHLIELRLALMVADGLTAMLVFALVSLARFGDGQVTEAWAQVGVDARNAAILFGIGWVAALWYADLYRLRVRWRLLTEAIDIAKATLLVLAGTLSLLFALNLDGVSRLFLVLLFATQPLVTLIGRALLRFGFGALRLRGHNTRFMIIAGTGTLAQDFADRVEARPALGIRVIGHLSVPGEPDIGITRPILGTLGELGAIFHTRVIDEIAICLPATAARYVEQISRLATAEGRTVRIPVDPGLYRLPNVIQEEFDGFVVRSLVRNDHALGLVAKRLIDITGAAVGLVVLSPLLLGTALVIRLDEGPPVLFSQTRLGLNGRPFTIKKFRTMVLDAEDRYAGLKASSDMTGAAFKMTDDPRVTPLGAFLRKTSLDELPQFWNVLRGEMSLVGPRPAPPREVADYDIWHRRRLSVRPGITGLWQVESRLDKDFDERAQLDLRYIDQWSLGLDLKILVRTIPAVLAHPGR